MPFKDPRIETPSDGERYQFKLTGDPAITGVKEPPIGRFYTRDHVQHAPGYIGTFVDENCNIGYHVWKQNEYEVASYRPVAEYLAELH